MSYTIKYFGRLEELTGTAEETLDLAASTVGELRAAVVDKHSALKEASYRIAVDHQIAEDTTLLNTGAEVALLPPFSGG